MGGGLMQLVAYGAQDVYLTGNPQITFFKVVYRRHTNFAMEAIQQTIDGSLSFGNTVSATISRNGDLVGRMYVQMNPNALCVSSNDNDYGPNICNAVLEEMTCEIGGQQIDRHYSHWLNTREILEEQLNGGCTLNTSDGQFVAGFEGAANGAVPPTNYQRMTHSVKHA